MINKTTPSNYPDKSVSHPVLLSVHERREALHNRLKSLELVEKIQEDVYFLKDRIAHIKRSHTASSNPSVLKTYQSMLESREAVLQSIYAEQDDHYDDNVKNNAV